ncbi:hypothetical protein [Vibrio sp. TRT 17S01]|uniref:hypothetical protein n=1 Tax=Vibrio sp. TRT 17S01 TaxID=3418505 RepID=UPI003CE952AB
MKKTALALVATMLFSGAALASDGEHLGAAAGDKAAATAAVGTVSNTAVGIGALAAAGVVVVASNSDSSTTTTVTTAK